VLLLSVIGGSLGASWWLTWHPTALILLLLLLLPLLTLAAGSCS